MCVGNLTIIGSDNGLSPGRPQAIIWTNDGILLIGPLRTNFSEILIEMQTFSFKKTDLKMSSGKGGHFVSASMCNQGLFAGSEVYCAYWHSLLNWYVISNKDCQYVLFSVTDAGFITLVTVEFI